MQTDVTLKGFKTSFFFFFFNKSCCFVDLNSSQNLLRQGVAGSGPITKVVGKFES